jgi:hypothetical protein
MDHEMQRIQKLQMFDEQMKRLDLQQRQEDKDILKNSALGPISPPNNNPTSKSSPSSRSLPGSRRNSGSEDNPDVLDFDNKLKLSDNEQRYSLICESDIDEKNMVAGTYPHANSLFTLVCSQQYSILIAKVACQIAQQDA